ncbi:hypothetical protein NL495_27520, partial [Klebsiella pneumoniae]|nr:hypothetical protein [Klebsiella pneumoniae]
ARHPAAPTASQSPGARTTEGVVEVIRAATLSPEAEKIQGTTRVMNAVYGYLQNVCGRKLDELSPTDVLKVGAILKTLSEFDVESSRR